jgi:hypothetical protein
LPTVGRRGALEAKDEIERRLLAEIDLRGSSGRAGAAELLGQSRDVIDRMWSSSAGRTRRDMRLHEATKIARWLGLELDLRSRQRIEPPEHARTRSRAAPRDKRQAV